MYRFIFLFFIFYFSTCCWAKTVIIANIFPLPELITSADSGPFIDVLREIEKCLPADVEMKRTLNPPSRAMAGILANPPTADFVFPGIDAIETKDLPFTYTKKSHGKVSFVIYSNKAKPIDRKLLTSSIKDKPYPFHVETFPDIQSHFTFPITKFSCMMCSLKRVNAGRLDALIGPMEELDTEIKQKKMNNLHRSLYQVFDAVMVIAKTPRGEQVGHWLDEAVACAEKKGNLQKLFLKVHGPYTDWQSLPQSP